MHGRKIRTDVSVQQLEQIVALTGQGMFRKEIAKQVKMSPFTVYLYQKRFELI